MSVLKVCHLKLPLFRRYVSSSYPLAGLDSFRHSYKQSESNKKTESINTLNAASQIEKAYGVKIKEETSFNNLNILEAAKRKLSPILYADTERYKIFSMSKDNLGQSVQLLKTIFVNDEPICKCLDIGNYPHVADDFAKIAKDIAKDGLSLVAIDKDNGKVLGFSFVAALQKPSPDGKSYYALCAEKCKHEKSKAYFNAMDYVTQSFDLFKLFDGAITPVFVGVAPNARNLLMGSFLFSLSAYMVRRFDCDEDFRVSINDESVSEINYKPEVFFAVLTGRHAQRIGLKLGFKNITKLGYEELNIPNGNIANIDPNDTCLQYVAMLAK